MNPHVLNACAALMNAAIYVWTGSTFNGAVSALIIAIGFLTVVLETAGDI